MYGMSKTISELTDQELKTEKENLTGSRIEGVTEADYFLGLLLKFEDVRAIYLEKMTRDIFPENRQQVLFDIIEKLWIHGLKVETQSIWQEILQDTELGWGIACPVGWWLSLADECFSWVNAEYYFNNLLKLAKKRKLKEVLAQANSENWSTDKLQEKLREAETPEKKYADSAEMALVTTGAIDSAIARGEGLGGTISGIRKLDKMLGGFKPQELVVVGARPSVGKSAFGLQVAIYEALHNNLKVAYFSLEMSLSAVGMRIVAMQSGINSKQFSQNPTQEHVESEHKVLQNIYNTQLYFHCGSVSILEIRKMCKKLKYQHGLDCAVIDYIGLVAPTDTRVTRVEQISGITRGLKLMADELNIPVLALSQLRRESEQEKRLPRLSDLRESGSIEQDADVVLLIHRERNKITGDLETQGTLQVAKQRNGETGSMVLGFNHDRVCFVENF